ncbi:hypothetical protein AJ79_03045 [Helicocarpus griseus UAMH5409]|uniref:Uncharacterized protein n=1 Tax=Helicocarpus griseus UAMH5409 TaxID=1447875 RepID=A0A2B7Y0L3_9EURO|nr:hypothetical protein AJ79_03045 [Helicocarpus griseus UAMH5409]
MPRLPPSLLRQAYTLNPLLPLLLRECRDIQSARNELRWLREYAVAQCQRRRNGNGIGSESGERDDNENVRLRLKRLVRQRAKGVPLQYILGDQPFGPLEILCRRGVLIPRPETESYTTRTANLILSKLTPRRHTHPHPPSAAAAPPPPALHILDLCTGTGCIPLLLHSLLAPTFPRLSVVGVDISGLALNLAWENLSHNIKLGALEPRASGEVRFMSGNVLAEDGLKGVLDDDYSAGASNSNIMRENTPLSSGSNVSSEASSSVSVHQTLEQNQNPPTTPVKILLSNPPYISPRQFTNGTTSRSVRLYEPKLALVPPPPSPSLLTEPSKNGDAVGAHPPATTLQKDMFYPRILYLAREWLNPDLVVLECGDPRQAGRVAEMARHVFMTENEAVEVEVWRCDHDGSCTAGSLWGGDEDGDGDRGARAVVVRRGVFLDR